MNDSTMQELLKVLQSIADELHEIRIIISKSDENPENTIKNEAIASLKTQGFDVKGFRNHLSKKGMSINTMDSYTDRIQRYFDKYSEINAENLMEFEAELKAYSPKTANLTIVAMVRYFKYIGYTGYEFTRIKEQKRTFCDNVLNEEQYNRLIEWSKENSIQTYKIAKIIALTGVRVSELITLKTADLERGYADITGKGNKTRRIYFPKSMIEDISPYCTGEYLIESRYGGPISTRGVAENLARAGEKCGLPKDVMHPHSLRHFFAKQFLKEKNDITLLGDLLGHSNIATTAIYTRMTTEEQQNQINNIVNW